MKTYKFSFIGRTNNAIGIVYPIIASVVADSREAAELRLYDKYELIRGITLLSLK